MAIDDLNKTGEHRIGEYMAVSKGAINNVVEKQFKSSFTGEGGGKRIGELLVEEGVMTQEELDYSLQKQRAARLLACPIFTTLSSIELASLSRSFTEVSLPPGETFIIQGDDVSSRGGSAYGLV